MSETFVAGTAIADPLFFNEGDSEEYAFDCYGTLTGFVYAIGIGSPYVTHVKIGFTTHSPRARLKSLQTGCPFPMALMAYVRGNEAFERELHSVLSDDRCLGEWFVYSEYVAAIISRLGRTDG